MKYKVRVTKAPDNTMAYGGQSGYGLDLGQRGIYDTMNESPYESVSDTAQEVPRSSANIEAERNETMVGDFDDDGHLEHMKIAGKPHSEGGTPLNVKPGTFVFSQTKKMAFGGPALQAFGKSGKTKYTPAQLAKQYDLNKYKAMLQNPDVQDDHISQRTAQMMYENNSKKLGMLALIQESMKGFPQGIPDIAQSVMPMGMEQNMQQMPEAMHGGEMYKTGGELPSFQTTGQYTGREISKKEFEALGKEWTRNGNRATRIVRQKIKDATPGTPGSPGTQGTPPTVHRAVPGGHPGKQWEDWIKAKLAQGVTIDELVKQGHGTPGGLKKYAPYYKPGTVGTPPKPGTPGTPEEWKETPEEVYFKSEPVIPNTPQVNPGKRPFFGNSLFVGPQREKFYAAPLNSVLPEPTFYDPNRMLAANAEQANMTKQYLSGFGAPQSFMANAAATDAKAFENAANINADYQNRNVGVANQFSPARAEIINRNNAYNVDRADKLFWNNQQGNKAYRNNLRQWMNNIDRYRENEYEVNTGMNLLNQTNPYYDMVDGPRGASLRFKPGVNVADLITNGGNGKSVALSPERMQQYEKAVAMYQTKKMTDAQMRPLLEAQFPEFFTDVRSSSKNLADLNDGYLGMLARRGVTGSGPSSIMGQ